MTTYLVGYIDTAEGRAALERAIGLAVRDSARLVLVNSTRAESLVDNKHVSQERLEEIEEQLQALGVEHAVVSKVAPDPGQAILAVAQEQHADMIVLGVRKRTPVGKLIMGSAAQQVLLNAHCDVLCVKPRREP